MKLKKKLCIFLLLITTLLFSHEVIKFNEFKKDADKYNPASTEFNDLLKTVQNKKLEWEIGWIYAIENYDATTDIIYIEMDRPNRNMQLNRADLYCLINKKISKRLGEYQMIRFNAIIRNYDYVRELYLISDIYMSGIM